MLDLCLRTQIDLARLTLIRHSARHATADAQVDIRRQFTELLTRLQQVTIGERSIFPEQMRALAAELKAFSDPDLANAVAGGEAGDLVADLPEVVTLLEANAAAGAGLSDRLSYFVRALQAFSRDGARPNDPAFLRLAEALPRPSDVVEELNQWCSTVAPGASLPDLAQNVVTSCRAMHRLGPMVVDLAARMVNLLYIPVIYTQARQGLAVPVRVVADFAVSGPPQFIDIESGARIRDSLLHVSFRAAVVMARDRAVRLLTDMGCQPPQRDFSLTVCLPRLSVGGTNAVYESQSFMLPLALAAFSQHPKLQPYVHLVPEVLATGPTTIDTLEIKALTITTVGGAQSLLGGLVETEKAERLPPKVRPIRVRSLPPYEPFGNEPAAYFPKEQLSRFHEAVGKVIELASPAARWNAPLLQRQRLPFIAPKHLDALAHLVRTNRVSQMQGFTGIGKTWLTAEWLREAQGEFDLVVHTTAPAGLTANARDAWATAQLKQLATALNAGWGIAEPALALSAAEPAADQFEQFIHALSRHRILWLIDDAQELLSSAFELTEPLVRKLIDTVLYQLHLDWKVLLVTNRRLLSPEPVPALTIDTGFTFDESLEYLNQSAWIHPDIRDRVARVLHGHPRALSLMAPFVSHYNLHQDEVAQWLDNLESASGEENLVREVCSRILSRVLERVTADDPRLWTALQVASTFLSGFTRSEFDQVAKYLRRGGQVDVSSAQLGVLDHMNLLTWIRTASQRYWSMHSLVRDYVQGTFQSANVNLFRLAHRAAGLQYFPLTSEGVQRETFDERYRDSSGCAKALAHFDLAGYEPGQNAVLNNWNEHQVPRAIRWMRMARHRGAPALVNAEQLLRSTISVYRSVDGTATGKHAAPPNIVTLLGRALARQQSTEKRLEAVECFELAIARGYTKAKSHLLSVLCDLSDFDPKYWPVATSLFAEVRRTCAEAPDAYPDIGEVYEKMAAQYVVRDRERGFDEAVLALEELHRLRVRWPKAYLLAVRLHADRGRVDEALQWVERGLELIPWNIELFREYVHLQVSRGEVNLPGRWRNVDRGAMNAYRLIGELIQSGMVDAAESLLGDAQNLYGRSEKWHLANAEIMQARGRLSNAIAELRAALRFNPRNHSTYLTVAALHGKLGDPTGALAALSAGGEATANPSILIALGEAYAEQGRPAEAEHAYRSAVTASPTISDGYIPLARLLESRDRTAEAESILRTATTAVEHPAVIYLALADLLSRQGKIDDAESLLKEAARVTPVKGYIALARLLESSDRTAEAESLLRAATATVEQPGFIYRELADLLIAHGKIDEAESLLTEAAGVTPDEPEIYRQLASLHSRKGRPAEAIAALMSGAKAAPSAAIFIALGDAYAEQSQLAEAEQAFRRAVAAAPANAVGYMALALFLELTDRVAEAESILKAALKEVERPGVVYVEFSDMLIAHDKIDEAEALLEEAMRVHPGHPETYRRLARLRLRQGRREDARSVLRRGVTAVPTGVRLARDLALAFVDEHGVDVSKAILDRALANYAPDGELHAAKGILLETTGDLDAAEKLYREGLANLRGRPHSVFHIRLHGLLVKQGRIEEARALVDSMRGITWCHEGAMWHVGCLFRDIGEDETAAAVFRDVLELDRRHWRATLALTSILQAQGKTEEAHAVLARGRWKTREVHKAFVTFTANARA